MNSTLAKPLPRVVILGAGFAGLQAAKTLRHGDLTVVVIDQHNHHLFQPLLYQVATAGLSAPDIASPIRKILKSNRNTTVLMTKALRVNPKQKVVETENGQVPYDFLVVAVGVTHSYFGKNHFAKYAPGLKNLADAFEIRNRILSAFEHAEAANDPIERQAWLTFAIVGGGPTGVELAGAICEIARLTLAKDFRNFDPKKTTVFLIEGQAHILPAYPESLREKAKAMLTAMGVTVLTSTLVEDLNGENLVLSNQTLPCRTIIWAAGVKASDFLKSLEAPVDQAGRVCVLPDLSLPNDANVFVVGDAASITSGEHRVPGVAPAALQMGRHAANNIMRRIDQKPTLAFSYVDKGSLATIGRSKGVADFGFLQFSGFSAWMLWLWIHIFFLIGFRNRVIVMLEWAFAYFSFQRSARLILPSEKKES